MSVYDPSSAPGAMHAQELYSQPSPKADLVPLINWVGALASIALIVGLSVWGYRLAVRDVSGVPVIAALEGPMRVQPDDPGGRQAEHQGLSVNRVQAEGTAAPTADQVILAPKPLDLSKATPAVPAQRAVARPDTLPQITKAAAPAPARDPAAAAQALIEELAAATSDADGPKIIPASAGGLARSPRPVARPGGAKLIRVRSPSAPATTASGEMPSYVEATSIASGTRLVQFGSYDSEEEAKAAFGDLYSKYGAYMGEVQPLVQQATSGTRSFHRLRVTGFDDIAEARQFCAVFSADNLTCIPVTAK